MKFTFDWLKEHLRTQASHMEIADRLPPLGLEVEEIIDNRKKLENFVVGYVTSAERHPSADRLKICLVDIGSQVLQIVCGAPNARAGIYVAVALEGVIIPATGTPLKRGVIRDVESQGMMCSAQELLLDDNNADSDGIMELHTREVGGDLATAIEMDDVIFDISVTPNRADCFCVRGVARDLAAAGIGELAPLPDLKISHVGNNEVGINIVTDQCRYFSTMALDGISGNTPKYIAKRLRAV
ncbi:MAG: hypothetical protein LBJ42_02125, partial [Holosporales bacterium]|nr:hypothetical protein [Holosporales bacterium]